MVAIGRESPRPRWLCTSSWVSLSLRLAKAPMPRRVSDLRITPERQVVVMPLIAPPAALTQREPNKKPLSTEFNVASITPRPEVKTVPSPGAPALPKPAPVNKFVPPPQKGTQSPTVAIPDAPSSERTRKHRASSAGLGCAECRRRLHKSCHRKSRKSRFETPGATTGRSLTNRRHTAHSSPPQHRRRRDPAGRARRRLPWARRRRRRIDEHGYESRIAIGSSTG